MSRSLQDSQVTAGTYGDPGVGKAQPVDEPVLTTTGWRPLGSIRVGDEVISVDGKATKVLAVHPQGLRKVARVEFTDGSSTRCDWDHLWTVSSRTRRKGAAQTLTLREINDLGVKTTDGSYRWRIPLASPIEFPEKTLPIHPYVMGCILGNGGLTDGEVKLTTRDADMVQIINGLLPKYVRCVITPASSGEVAPAYRIAVSRGGVRITDGHRPQVNPILDALRAYGLMGHRTEDKFIPETYLFASVQQRIDLVQGLLDTDGYVPGQVEFGSSSKQLFDGFTHVVRSLGGVVTERTKIPTYDYLGEKRKGLRSWTGSVAWGCTEPPVRVERRRAAYKPRMKYAPQRRIFGIQDAGEAECVCIVVEHPSHLYVTRDFVVTHNSSDKIWSFPNGVHIAGKTALIPAVTLCGFEPTKIVELDNPALPQIRDAVKAAVKKYPKLDSVVIDDMSNVLQRSARIMEGTIKDGRAMYRTLGNNAQEAIDEWVSLGLHVIVDFHVQPPRFRETVDTKTGNITRHEMLKKGEPMVPGNIIGPAVVSMFETFLRVVPLPPDPMRSGDWPYGYSAGPDGDGVQWQTKDRWNVVRGVVPMNLGEIFRAAGKILSRPPGWEWHEETIAGLTKAVLEGHNEIEAVRHIVGQMLGASKGMFEIKALVRDLRARIELARKRSVTEQLKSIGVFLG